MKHFNDLRERALSHPGNTFSAAQVLEVLGTLDGIEAVLDAERADSVRLEDAVLRASHTGELYQADAKREYARAKQAITAANKWRDKYRKARRLVTEARAELAAPLLRRAEAAERERDALAKQATGEPARVAEARQAGYYAGIDHTMATVDARMIEAVEAERERLAPHCEHQPNDLLSVRCVRDIPSENKNEASK